MLLAVLPAAARQNPDIDLDDKNITAAIEMEYWDDAAVPSNRIDVETSNGIVTLTGSIDHILAKERAERIAELTRSTLTMRLNHEIRPDIFVPSFRGVLRDSLDTLCIGGNNPHELKPRR